MLGSMLHRLLASHSVRGAKVVALGVLLLSAPLFCQQAYVSRFDVYGGYAFLNSPAISLFENGFATQVGIRPKTWMSFGFDYTIASGDLTVTTSQLLPTLQTNLQAGIAAGIKAGVLPATYPYGSMSVAAHSRTQTFAVGPQLAYRHFSKATLFLRPVFAGIIHETVTPQPQDAVLKALVGSLITTPTKSNNVLFFGFGGGFDIILSKHFAWRTQGDLVYDHLFDDLLKDGRFTTRFSSGPAFNFGKNVEK
uniref:Outer membrane protein beta-barrel domain-containing protein n=1 Tax=Solibacter usitatus (strain Ellin6076) TaxID=234267 RepID=Q01UJ6_SOLUE